MTEVERAKLKTEIVEEVFSRISPQLSPSVLFDAPWSPERLERIEQLERAVRQLQESGVPPVSAANAAGNVHTSSDAEANIHCHTSHGVALPVPEGSAAVAVEKPDSNTPGAWKRKLRSRLLRGIGSGRFSKAGKASKAAQDGYALQPSMWDATLVIGFEKIGTLPAIKSAILLMLNVIVQGQCRYPFVVVHSLVQHSAPLLLFPYRLLACTAQCAFAVVSISFASLYSTACLCCCFHVF